MLIQYFFVLLQVKFVTKYCFFCDRTKDTNMTYSIEEQIFKHIIKRGRGKIYFGNKFSAFGSNDAVRQAFSRLCRKGNLIRLSAGIYLYPRFSKLLGDYVHPSIEEIAEEIAKNEKIRIIPTGLYALNKLGLSTQVPMRVIFLTDGTPRSIKIKGKVAIIFQKTIPKYLSFKGKATTLVIFALKEIGNGNATTEELSRINEVLSYEKPEIIRHDAVLAPAWISDILLKSIEK